MRNGRLIEGRERNVGLRWKVMVGVRGRPQNSP
jgi:hypothetical protein